MDRIVSILWTLAEVISTVCVCDTLLSRREGRKNIYLEAAIAFAIIFTFTNLYRVKVPTVAISCMAYLLLTIFCYNGPFFYQFMAVIMSALFLSIIDSLYVYLWSSFRQIEFSEILNRKYTYLTIGTLSKSSGLLLSWVFRRIKTSKNGKRISIRWLALTLLFPAISLTMLLVVYESYRHDLDFSSKALGFTLAIALGNIGIMYLIHRLENSELELHKSSLLSQQMEIQTQSILMLEKSYRNQRKISHEFSHHLNTIQNLLDNAEYIVASDYVHKLQNRKITSVFSVNTHNAIVDAILNEKYQVAMEKGIDMQIRVSDLSDVNIPLESIVVMLSNLLENAIEACLLCDCNKSIHFSFVCDSTIFITIVNTSNPVTFIDGKPVSTKINSLNHGFGLDNTCKILDSLGAEYAFQYRDGFFSFAAEIPRNKPI